MMTMIGLASYRSTFGKGPVLQPTSEGYFDFLMGLGVSLRLLLTLATMFGGTLILATVIRHYRRHSERSASVFNGTGIIEWTSLGLLGFHLFFFQIYDEYSSTCSRWRRCSWRGAAGRQSSGIHDGSLPA